MQCGNRFEILPWLILEFNSKNYEKWSTFIKVITKNKWYTFLRHGVQEYLL